jgi:hypothetical protein
MDRAGDRRKQAWALAVLGMVGVDQGDLRPDLPTGAPRSGALDAFFATRKPELGDR